MKENIRDRLDRTTEENMYDLLNKDYDASMYRQFVGRIVDNNDPDKIGRCKIRVFGVFGPEIPDNDLPWAIPEFHYLGSSMGNFIVPPVDTIVRVHFDCGEIYLPIYTTKVLDKSNLPSQKDTDYPDTMVMFTTDEGDYLTINRSSKVTTYNHNSGTQIIIQEDGSVEMNLVKDHKIDVTGDAEVNVTGNAKIQGATVEIGSTTDLATPPSSTGGFCALPACLFTGGPHVAKKMV